MPRPLTLTSPDTRRQFVALSVILTGFNDAELWGTGMVDVYLDWIRSIIGDSRLGDLLSASQGAIDASNGHEATLDRLVRLNIMDDETLGPVARNLIVLWYLGQWNQLPPDWRDAHGASALDLTCMVSPDAYAEGLVWKAIHTHPQGAKQPGFGSWSLPPVVPAEESPRRGRRKPATRARTSATAKTKAKTKAKTTTRAKNSARPKQAKRVATTKRAKRSTRAKGGR